MKRARCHSCSRVSGLTVTLCDQCCSDTDAEVAEGIARDLLALLELRSALEWTAQTPAELGRIAGEWCALAFKLYDFGVPPDVLKGFATP